MMEFMDMNVAKGRKMAEYIASLATSTSGLKSKDIFCYRFYHGLYNEDDFNYLRAVRVDSNTLLEYPAKVRFIPIIRPKLNYLKSQYALMEIDFKVKTVDPKSIKEKYNNRLKEYLNIIDNRIQEKAAALYGADQGIELQRQKMAELMQQQQQQPSIEQQMQAIMGDSQLSLVKKNIERQQYITDEEISLVDEFYKYKATDIVELSAEKLLRYAIDKLKIKNESIKAFTDKMVTGKPIYHVFLPPGERWPRFKAVNPLNVYWSSDEDADYIQNTRWAVLRSRMTASQLIDNYKYILSKKILEQIKHGFTTSGFNSIIPQGMDKAVDSYTNYQLYNGTRTLAGYDIFHIYWKSPRRVFIKKVPNKYQEGRFFTKFIDQYEAETWNQKRPQNEAQGEKLEIRYVNDIWEAINIAQKETVLCRPLPVQNRDSNYNVELPIIGETFNHYAQQPYSLVWTTKDIQITYNIINYHRELMFAIAGTKGTIVDDTQRPEEMSRKEWQYHKKMGTLHIDTTKMIPGRRPSTFNQWTNYDETVSPVVAQLTDILESIEETAARVTGVSRQATSQIVSTDQVGTSQLAVRQTQLLTEILYYEHDQILKMALTRFANLCRITSGEGGEYSFYNQDIGEEVFTIPKDLFKERDLEVFLSSSSNSYQNMKELKEMIGAAWGKGMLPLDNVIKLYNTTSLTELQRKAEYFAEKAQKIAALNAQSDAKAKQDGEMEKLKFEKEYEKFFKEQEMTVKQAQLEIDKARLTLEKQRLQLDAKAQNDKSQMDMANMELEHGIEEAYLQEQSREAQVDEKLRSIEIQLQALTTEEQLKQDDKKDARDKEMRKEEIKSAERQSKLKNREKIKD